MGAIGMGFSGGSAPVGRDRQVRVPPDRLTERGGTVRRAGYRCCFSEPCGPEHAQQPWSAEWRPE